MFTKKQAYILVILFLILVGGVFLYKTQYQHWPWDQQVTLISPIATPSDDGLRANKEPREIVMEDAAKRINEISPVQPVLGGQWYVLRYWFIDGSDNSFYVECEDGHIMRKFLLTADLSQKPAISYKVNAIFEPGESDWILKSGQDKKSALPLILFEYDAARKQWAQRN